MVVGCPSNSSLLAVLLLELCLWPLISMIVHVMTCQTDYFNADPAPRPHRSILSVSCDALWHLQYKGSPVASLSLFIYLAWTSLGLSLSLPRVVDPVATIGLCNYGLAYAPMAFLPLAFHAQTSTPKRRSFLWRQCWFRSAPQHPTVQLL